VKNYKPLLLVILPVLIGTAIYVIWRPDTLIVFQWARALGLLPIVNSSRQALAEGYKFVPSWVIYSLPNALWIFSYAIVISYLWRSKEKGIVRTMWLLSPIILGVGYEFMQLIRVIPGTFCQFDIAFALSGSFLGLKIPVQSNK